MLAQTCKDFELVYMDNASVDGSVEFVRKNYPSLRIIANRKNLGYAGGHNKFFSETNSEFLMVLNPDVELSPNYLEEAIKAFENKKVGAVMGKLLRPAASSYNTDHKVDEHDLRGRANRAKGQKTIIDSTGITINLARRGRDRGQWEEDKGQYDNQTEIFGVNGAASVFRKSALEKVKTPMVTNHYSASRHPLEPQAAADGVEGSGFEYFDEDFFAYWEDLDLSWRMNLAGFKCSFVPKAVAYHKRAAGRSKGGYGRIINFIRYHKTLPKRIRQLNWKNHLFCIIKNDFGWKFFKALPVIKLREFIMLIYILIFEPSTLGVIPEFFKQLPKMLKKRKYIKNEIVNKVEQTQIV